MKRVLRFIRRLLTFAVLISLMVILLQYSTYPTDNLWNAVAVVVHDHLFDYVSWELEAIGVKIGETLFGLHPFITETDRIQLVRNYMADLSEALTLEAQVNAIFTDPNVSDPEAESANLRLRRDSLRADLRSRQALVEGILEGQVAAVLVEHGFGHLGQLFPPISMRFTEVPNLVIVSPRETIRFDVSINVDPMNVDEMAALEAEIDRDQNVSSLIVPLGGISLFPAMILETPSIPRAVEVFAHEWLHHYLLAFPLGLNYDLAGESRIINETTASVFGQTVGRLVLERYYPDLVPPPPVTPLPSSEPPPEPVFDFGREMDITRRRVDELLAQGEIEAAEAYMEERREFFFDNGYLIRKLNQAYFAFYGGYQAPTGLPGAGGADPIGPAVQGILDASPSVYDWIQTMGDIITRDTLVETWQAMQSGVEE